MGTWMTDLEMTLVCAAAMGWKIAANSGWDEHQGLFGWDEHGSAGLFHPLNDDTQAMSLIKKFRLVVDGGNSMWCVHGDVVGSGVINDSLNRAVMECVAKGTAAPRRRIDCPGGAN
jgi:hypothetical protein